jgi:hypothetical protein
VRPVALVAALAACTANHTAPPADAPAPQPAAPTRPHAAGEARTSFEGCLAAPAEPATRGAPPAPAVEPGVVVEPAPGGLRVLHRLTHACCLKGAGKSAVDGQRVQVTLELSGQACRCMCGSSVTTFVPLRPGDYDVTVQLVEAGGPARTVHEQTIALRGLRDR